MSQKILHWERLICWVAFLIVLAVSTYNLLLLDNTVKRRRDREMIRRLIQQTKSGDLVWRRESLYPTLISSWRNINIFGWYADQGTSLVVRHKPADWKKRNFTIAPATGSIRIYTNSILQDLAITTSTSIHKPVGLWRLKYAAGRSFARHRNRLFREWKRNEKARIERERNEKRERLIDKIRSDK